MRIFLAGSHFSGMPTTAIDQFLSLLCMALAALALARILFERLWEIPFYSFAVMLAVSLVRDIGLLLIPYHSHLYALTWGYTLLVLLAVQAYAAVSTYRAIAQLYTKIDSFAVWLFGGCLLVAAALCCLGLPLEVTRISQGEAFLRSMFLAYRWNAALIAGALMLAVGYLWRFPSPMKRLPRNLVYHTCLLAAYFTSNAILYLCENLFPLGGALLMERIHWIVACGLYLTWALKLSAAGNATEAWPPIDDRIVSFIEQRNQKALDLLRQVASRR
jgi:hypothetical protein